MTHEQEGRNDDCTINTQTTNQTTETNNNYNISTANYSIQSTYTNSQKSIPINDDTLRITIWWKPQDYDLLEAEETANGSIAQPPWSKKSSTILSQQIKS